MKSINNEFRNSANMDRNNLDVKKHDLCHSMLSYDDLIWTQFPCWCMFHHVSSFFHVWNYTRMRLQPKHKHNASRELRICLMGTWILHSIAWFWSPFDSKDLHNGNMIYAWYTGPTCTQFFVISSRFQVIKMSLSEGTTECLPNDHRVCILRHSPKFVCFFLGDPSKTWFDVYLTYPAAAGRHEIARRLVFFFYYRAIGHCFWYCW